MGEFPGLRIIIVNYNHKNDTISCIESLNTAGAGLEQIFVVDNASMDNSVETFMAKFGKSLNIIASPTNKGYPGALNLGIPKALENGAEWVLLMNNDTEVDQDFIIELEKAVKARPDVALFGPLILYYESPETIWYLGAKVIPGTLIGVRSFRGKRLSSKIPATLPMDLFHGCAMMVRKDVFETIGLFDDSQLIYGDDADFSWRAKQAGFVGAAATRAKMWHKISLTMGRQKPRTRYLITRNTIRFYNRYTRGFTRLIMFLFTFIRCTWLMITDIVKARFELIKPLWLGFWDGWRGNYARSY